MADLLCRLLALKASGLNTVTTYIPWNAHEPAPGEFDFSDTLNIIRFLEVAQSLELYVILRIGPYICAGLTCHISAVE